MITTTGTRTGTSKALPVATRPYVRILVRYGAGTRTGIQALYLMAEWVQEYLYKYRYR